MVYSEVIRGKFVDLRSIGVEDAQFSYDIRADERNCKTVGQVAQSVDKQRQFIEWQMQQPNDYYFVVMNKSGERIGLIGVYNIHDDIGELGREVNNGNPMESMEAEVLLADFCREVLHLKKTCAVIYADNKKHISIQKKRGYEPLYETERNGISCLYYENMVTENDHAKIRALLDKIEV